jgi:adenylyltransferase/sulfurtransferase
MSVTINIPIFLQAFAGDKDSHQEEGNTVGEALLNLCQKYPDMKKLLFDRQGKLLTYIGIYLNAKDAYPDELSRPVNDGDVIHVLMLIAGG